MVLTAQGGESGAVRGEGVHKRNEFTSSTRNQNAAFELTDENTQAGNALWATLTDVLDTGNLMYKATNPKKARTYAAATLLKRIRQENGTGDGKPPMPGVAQELGWKRDGPAACAAGPFCCD